MFYVNDEPENLTAATVGRTSNVKEKLRYQDVEFKYLKSIPTPVYITLPAPLDFLDDLLSSEVTYRNQIISIQDSYLTPLKKASETTKDLFTQKDLDGNHI